MNQNDAGCGFMLMIYLQSMYIRVKRANQTIFIYAEPSDSIVDVKTKIAAINKVPVDSLRLIFANNPLEDSKTLVDYRIENDNVVFVVYKKEGMLYIDHAISSCIITQNINIARHMFFLFFLFVDYQVILNAYQLETTPMIITHYSVHHNEYFI